jgi:hypothetical protein
VLRRLKETLGATFPSGPSCKPTSAPSSLAGGEKTGGPFPPEVVDFWAKIMEDHAEFIAHLLDPQGQTLIAASRKSADLFQKPAPITRPTPMRRGRRWSKARRWWRSRRRRPRASRKERSKHHSPDAGRSCAAGSRQVRRRTQARVAKGGRGAAGVRRLSHPGP